MTKDKGLTTRSQKNRKSQPRGSMTKCSREIIVKTSLSPQTLFHHFTTPRAPRDSAELFIAEVAEERREKCKGLRVSKKDHRLLCASSAILCAFCGSIPTAGARSAAQPRVGLARGWGNSAQLPNSGSRRAFARLASGH
jgi:hypothetical protein